MALTEHNKADKIEVVSTGLHPVVQVRCAVWVEKDGVPIGGKQYHRYVLMPDTDLTNENSEVAAVANAVFTDEVKAAYVASLPVEEPVEEESGE